MVHCADNSNAVLNLGHAKIYMRHAVKCFVHQYTEWLSLLLKTYMTLKFQSLGYFNGCYWNLFPLVTICMDKSKEHSFTLSFLK